jgi:hypothetical protein
MFIDLYYDSEQDSQPESEGDTVTKNAVHTTEENLCDHAPSLSYSSEIQEREMLLDKVRNVLHWSYGTKVTLDPIPLSLTAIK